MAESPDGDAVNSSIELEHRPCTRCDGWLMAQAKHYETTELGNIQIGERWVCRTCGLVDEVDTDPRTVKP